MKTIMDAVNKILGRASEAPNEPFKVSFEMSLPMAEYHRLYIEKRHRAFVAEEAIEKAREGLKEAGARFPIDLPKEHPAYMAYMKASQELSATWDYAKLRFEALGLLISKEEFERWHEEWLDYQYRLEFATSTEEHISPSGRYKLIVTVHPTQPGVIERTLGRIFSTNSDVQIVEVRRNYRRFPFAWVENHPHDGRDYILCGEDYQGQTLVDLTSGTKESTLPSMAGMGGGFCWASIHPSPDRNALAVTGCFWGAPYECVFYDFRIPKLPVLELERFDYDKFHGWNEDGTASLDVEYEIRKSDGKKYRDMTEEEQDALESDNTGYTKESITWVRPTYVEVAKRLAASLAWRIDEEIPVPKEWVDEFERLMNLITPEQQREVRNHAKKESSS